MRKKISPVNRLSGIVQVPGDKSISHRALIFGAIARGTTRAYHLLESGDVHSTQRCLRSMGVEITSNGQETRVHGRGKKGLLPPQEILDCGNSGTTMRLLMGLLAGQNFQVTLTGDDSLIKRPMKRVAAPLTQMGAVFQLTQDDFAPLTLFPDPKNGIHGIEYSLKIASAQVKTSLLLAGLYASGKTILRGELGSRDHTERMLPSFGVRLQVTPEEISISSQETLFATEIHVPGDPSSAAFWMAGACLVKEGDIFIKNVSLNPTRIGFLKVLERMGAKMDIDRIHEVPEPIGHIRVCSSSLQGTQIRADEVPSLIDEIPILSILATQAEGVTEIHGAEELRFKETDRIEAVARNLRAMGVMMDTFKDGWVIQGPQRLKGAQIDSFSDHRIAMAFSIAGLIAEGETEIQGIDSMMISYPQFYDTLGSLV